MEAKYTDDGKKVIVIGNLNSQEKIVQEIFIQNNQEVPSGENFIVKSLHDFPSKSWKETNLEKLEANYNKRKKEFEDSLSQLEKTYKEESSMLKNVIKQFNFSKKVLSKDSFKRVIDFISGKTTHVVISEYSEVKIKTFLKATADIDRWNVDLKLCSIFGRSDGDLYYGIDGSSSVNTKVFPCNSYEEAFQKAKSIILEQANNKGVTEYLMKSAETLKIELPKEALLKFYEDKLKSKDDSIARRKEYFEKEKQSRSEITNMIKTLK